MEIIAASYFSRKLVSMTERPIIALWLCSVLVLVLVLVGQFVWLGREGERESNGEMKENLAMTASIKIWLYPIKIFSSSLVATNPLQKKKE